MYNRKRMINWIRICRRLNSLNAQAPFYRSRRLLWIRFNRWLKFVAKEKLNATPGIIPVIQRRCFLHPDFSRALMKKGFQKIVYHNSKRLGQSTSDYHSLFMRWKSYTQERLLFAMLKAKAKKLFQLRLVQKCLWALKTGLSVGENMHLIANEPKKFPILRVEADLDQLTKRFISQRRAGVAHVITKYNRKFSEKMKNAGRKALSFKLFLTQFEEETTARINNEQRILSESFEQRGQQEFIDVYAPDKDDPIMPEIMARMEGKIIADPHQEATDGRDIVLPGGFRVLKMKFVLQDNTTIVGWQIVWGADGCKDIESPRRGTWNSASITIHELVVPKDDFIIGLEYLYDGAAMLGVRLKLFLNGFTRWIGKKNSMSTLSVYLSAEMAPTEDFEKDRETFGNDEKKHPALPYNFVVGLTGKLVNGKTTCLSLIVRKIISQNVFSYFWVKDVLDSMAADQSAAADAANKSVGLHVDSLPSQVIYRERIAAEGRVVEESLTMTDALNQRKNVLDASKSDTIGAYSGMNNDGRENKIDEPAEINSSDGKTEEDGDDDRSASNDEKSIGSQSIDSADAISLYSAKTLTSLEQRKRDKKLQIRKKQFEERLKVPLNMLITESERQFFDVMRMRMTELTCAVQRAYDFARKLWTKKDFRTDPQLSKLTGIRIVSRLCMWYFNSISRRLMRLCPSEKKGMQLLRSGKRMLQNADTIRKRAIAAKLSCIIAENSVHSWTGKALLAPSERAEKRELQLRMSKLREQAQKDEKDSKEITLKGKELLRAGKLLLPRIELSQSIYTNYRLKVLASRHKQSLLERMDMETIKNGLFGIDQRESTLSRLHMESIHSSLKERKTLLNMQKKEDPHSLDRFIETVIEEEAELEIVEERQRRATAMTNATLSEWQKSTVKRDSIGPSYMANTIRRSQSIRQPIKRHSTAAEVDRKPTKF